MPIPEHARMQDFLGLGSERAHAPREDDAVDRPLTEAARSEAAPSGVPAGASFTLARVVRRVATFVLFLSLAACEGGPEGAGATPPASVPSVSLARWSPVASGLDRADAGDGIACYRAWSESGRELALSCVRVAPMRWQVAPGPRIGRAGAVAETGAAP